jgi:integrase
MIKLELKNDVWHVVGTVRVDGESIRVRKTTGFPKSFKKQAENAMTEIIDKIINSKGGKDVSVGEAVRLYQRKPDGLGRTSDLMIERLRKEFKDVRLANWSKVLANDWVCSGNKKASTIARDMGIVNAMLNYSQEYGLSAPDWRMKKPKNFDARERWLSDSDRDEFILGVNEDIRDIVLFLFFTGARLGEALSLRSEDVIGDVILLRTRKTSGRGEKIRSVPVHAVLEGVVSDKEGLIFQRDGEQWTQSRFHKAWNESKVRMGVEDFRPHDCRHTFASLLVQKGVSLKVVQELLGHSSIVMVTRYAHLSPTQLASAVDVLGVGEALMASPTGVEPVV